MRFRTANNAIKRVKAELAQCFPSVSILSKYQATNSPSKIEGAGGEYDVFVEFPLIFRCVADVHTPPNPLYLRGETSFLNLRYLHYSLNTITL